MSSPAAVSAVTSSSAGLKATLVLTEERKQKRKESNRLSAQRSRARKQLQVDELEAQVAALRARNAAMAAVASESARRYAVVHAENELLRARRRELTAHWESLAELVQYMDAASAASFNTFAGVNGAVLPQPLLLDTAMYYNYYY